MILDVIFGYGRVHVFVTVWIRSDGAWKFNMHLTITLDTILFCNVVECNLLLLWLFLALIEMAIRLKYCIDDMGMNFFTWILEALFAALCISWQHNYDKLSLGETHDFLHATSRRHGPADSSAIEIDDDDVPVRLAPESDVIALADVVHLVDLNPVGA